MSTVDPAARIDRDINTGRRGVQGPPVGQGALDVGELGTLWLVWGARGLRRIVLPGGERPSPDGEPATAPVPEVYARPLRRYFAGEPVDPALIAVELEGTDFQRRVWNALRRIPRGRVRPYGGVASDIGAPRAMRAVGMANRNNPLPVVVPCHRVVQKGARLGGYSGGLDTKRLLLSLEGVRVEGDRVMPGQLELF